ncbi:hypothetical protein [Vulcanisaeta distributa]|uniref:hypothetical protein n=1 Tax=Vulcanisaeta distributa TaxID=164451 RepID=UPI000AE4A387|nr:hypothetical protein [Vulcanisaeta distributa]
MAVVVVASLFVFRFFITRPVGLPTPVPSEVSYGYLLCYGDYVVIPGNTMVILYFHPHGSVVVNGVGGVFIAFPLGIINETLSALSRLPSWEGSMVMGVYVNGRLIAINDNQSVPTESLIHAVNQPYPYAQGNTTQPSLTTFWQFARSVNLPAIYTVFSVGFSAINVTPGDTIAVVIYSAVPYALPVCNITSEAEEVQLMVGNGWIGHVGPPPNATPTAEQLYMEGEYVIEEPVIYVVNASGSVLGAASGVVEWCEAVCRGCGAILRDRAGVASGVR